MGLNAECLRGWSKGGGRFMQELPQMGVTPKMVGRLRVHIGQRTALPNDSPLFIQDQRECRGADAPEGNCGLCEGVVDLSLRQSEQRLHKVLVSLLVHVQPRFGALPELLEPDSRECVQPLGYQAAEAR